MSTVPTVMHLFLFNTFSEHDLLNPTLAVGGIHKML